MKAVLLSYAREDTAATQRIAEALRAAGVEVRFDQSELRGSDARDAKIRTLPQPGGAGTKSERA